jgi:hypothetical protein
MTKFCLEQLKIKNLHLSDKSDPHNQCEPEKGDFDTYKKCKRREVLPEQSKEIAPSPH